MQPWVLALQVRYEVSPAHVVPVLLPHPPVGAGQTQAAPEQTRPEAAQLVSASCRQLCASAVQRTSVLFRQ